MNRHYIIASHAHFAKGLYESVKLLVGEHADVDILNAFSQKRVSGHKYKSSAGTYTLSLQ